MGSGWGISLLIPFRANPGDPGYRERLRNFEWVKAYWEEQLPLAEFIHGHDESVPYSKTRAVNDAARRATGDIFVILDADAYLHPDVIEKSAREIRVARREGRKLWYVPYRRFYRLDHHISEMITHSDPGNPLVLPDPPPRRYVERVQTYSGNSDFRAHWYGALIQVMPREAFEACGGMDERFAGWGSEDVAFMRAVDTLYAPHKSFKYSVCHLYHPRMGKDVTDRKWAGQDNPNSNWPLSKQYLEAKGDPAKMRKVVDGDPKGRGSVPRFASGGVVSGANSFRVPGGLPGPPAELSHEPAELFYYSASEVGYASVPAGLGAGSSGRARPVGRVKRALRWVKGFVSYLWNTQVLCWVREFRRK